MVNTAMKHNVLPSLAPLLVDISTLTPDPKNRRKHPERSIVEIMRSYEANGQRKPIVVQKISDDGVAMVVRAGNGQLEAMKRLGWTHAAAVVVDEKDREAARFALQDNRTPEFSEWDSAGLRDELAAMQQTFGFEAEDLGWNGGEVIELLGNIDDRPSKPKPTKKRGAARAKVTETPVPEAPRATVTQLGDVWKMDGHVLICGDCTTIDPLRLKLGEVGFGFTSPPYNAGKNVSKTHGETRPESRYLTGDRMTDEQYLELLVKSTRLMLGSCRVAAVNIQSIANNKRVIVHFLRELLDHYADKYIWTKTAPPPTISPNVPNSKFEDIYMFSADKDASRAIETANFHGTVTNVHEGPGVRGNAYADIHNATMPSHLAEWMLAVFAEKADFVVDPFGGTGTTLMVADQLGKRCALTELDPRYCDVIVERWQDFTGHKATRSKS